MKSGRISIYQKKIGVIFASVLFLAIYLNRDNLFGAFDKSILNAKVLSMDEIDSLCEGKEEAFLEPKLQMNDAAIAYDSEQNMLLIPQSLSEAAFEGELQVPEGKLYFLEDATFDNKAEAIAQNTIFRLFWVTDTQCWMYNVYFTGMPVMNLETASCEEGYVDGNVWIYDQYRQSAGFQSAEGSWRLRGATTLEYEKSSYRLTLTDKKLSLLGMRRDDDWILSALYDDEGLIHNKLSFEVWREIAADNHVNADEGIQMEYVELFMDNQYLGIYGLMERVDKKLLSLNDKDILYKCVDQKEPGEDDFYSELTEEMNPTYELKYPEELTEENWRPMKQWASVFLADEIEDYDSAKAMLNMENAVDYNLFNILICGMDNIMKNIYFYADYQSDDSYQFIKIPWDLNMTWGNSWIDDSACFYNMYQEKNLTNEDGWTEDMYRMYEANPKEIGHLLNQRWKELREKIITKQSITKKAELNYQYLYSSGAFTRNANKWPRQMDYWTDDFIYQYIDQKIDYLDNYFEGLD